MQDLLASIKSGEFAKAWIAENESGRAGFMKMRADHASTQIEEVGKDLRAMMPFLDPITVDPSE